jgi:outer membrane immunogenic protein
MKGILMTGVAMATLTSMASAADLGAYRYTKAPVAVSPVYNWTGFYIGGNAGYGWGKTHDAMALGGVWLTDGTGDNVPLSSLGNGRLTPNDLTGGIQSGFNYQIQQWVLGIEVDANYFGMKKDLASGVFSAPSGNTYAFTSSFESNWLITVRPRVGYAFDRTLVYATGGLAIANQKFSQSITQFNLAFNESGSVSATTVGWTVGAGAEYALDNRWSAKAEYLYVDPGSVSFSTRGSDPAYVASHSANLKANIVRLGINYRFN